MQTDHTAIKRQRATAETTSLCYMDRLMLKNPKGVMLAGKEAPLVAKKASSSVHTWKSIHMYIYGPGSRVGAPQPPMVWSGGLSRDRARGSSLAWGPPRCTALHLCTFAPLHCTHCIALHCTSMQCNAMQCNALQCNAMQCNAMQCYAMLCYAMQCQAMQNNAM